MKKYIKSPLNYTGGKYKLLDQILPLFPKDIDTFVDVFGGGFNVGINVDAKRVIYNDSMPILSELLARWKSISAEQAIEEVENVVKKYGLTQTSLHGYKHYGVTSSDGVAKVNKEAFLKLRADYNKTKDIKLFYTMLVHAFNNQIRFNDDGDFNGSVNKRDFNKNIRKNLAEFVDKLNQIDMLSLSIDYRLLRKSYFKEDLNYYDPPYLGATATYNENGGWTEKSDEDLRGVLDKIDFNGGRFALSAVMENKGVENTALKMWSLKYNVHYLDHNYGNCSYQAKDKSKDSTVEILITNY